MTAYYNEFDPKAAAWLRELIKAGLIADGEIDERSITDVDAGDLVGFTQCHFFAGIGGWSYALRLAGWPDDRPVWTGSAPCQPFSAAGAGLAADDARHLAPKFIDLVRTARPAVLFGEQVASAAVLGRVPKAAKQPAAPEWAWIDDLSDRLEAAHYAVGTLDIPAADVGAPHIRQRTWFRAERLAYPNGAGRRQAGCDTARDIKTDAGWPGDRDSDASAAVGLADAGGEQQHRGGRTGEGRRDEPAVCGAHDRPSAPDEFWRDADWLFCRDGKWRPVVASYVSLPDGIPHRLVPGGDKGTQQKEAVDGTEGKAHPGEALQSVRDQNDAQTVQRTHGGSGGVHAPGLLRPSVHGEGDGEGCLPEPIPQPSEGREDGRREVRGVRKDGKASRSSPGREPFQQYPVELEDVVSSLPFSITLAELHGRRRDAEALRALCAAICESGSVPYAPDQAQAVWASLCEEAQDRVKLGHDHGWIRVMFHPLSQGEVGRVARLRGYGNAIVPQVAAEFIRLTEEAIGE